LGEDPPSVPTIRKWYCNYKTKEFIFKRKSASYPQENEETSRVSSCTYHSFAVYKTPPSERENRSTTLTVFPSIDTDFVYLSFFKH